MEKQKPFLTKAFVRRAGLAFALAAAICACTNDRGYQGTNFAGQSEAAVDAPVPVPTTPPDEIFGQDFQGDDVLGALTPVPTATPTSTGTPAPTPNPDPSATPGVDPSPDPTTTPGSTPTPTPTPSATPGSDPTPTPSPEPSASPSPTPQPSASPSPTPTPIATPAVVGLSLSPDPASVIVNAQLDFTLRELRSDGTSVVIAAQNAVWTSSNQNIARISAGRVYGLAEGSIGIAASFNGRSVSAVLNVLDPFDALIVGPAQASIAIGVEQGFSAQAVFRSGRRVDVTGHADWASSAPAVGGMVARGRVRGVGGGNANIMAFFGGKSGSASLRVFPGVPTQTAGINFEDAGDGDFNDAVLCFEGQFSVDAGSKRVVSTLTQSVNAKVENRSACDHAMEVVVTGEDGREKFVKANFTSRSGEHFAIPFQPGDELRVRFVPLGFCFQSNDPIAHYSARGLVETSCRTSGN